MSELMFPAFIGALLLYFLWRSLFISAKQRRKENYDMSPVGRMLLKLSAFGVCFYVAIIYVVGNNNHTSPKAFSALPANNQLLSQSTISDDKPPVHGPENNQKKNYDLKTEHLPAESSFNIESLLQGQSYTEQQFKCIFVGAGKEMNQLMIKNIETSKVDSCYATQKMISFFLKTKPNLISVTVHNVIDGGKKICLITRAVSGQSAYSERIITD